MRPIVRLALGVAATAAVVGLVGARLSPPAPRGTDAPASGFSADRALVLVRDLAGDGSPRPTGSEANRAGVARLVALFRSTGLEPEVQETFACGPYGVCARVRNVLARIGGPGKKAVLLSAHHDSVAAGPGASDDLVGVAAILESARVLGAGPSPARPILLLVSDSEETGLVGATAFVEQHPWAREVGAVVNLEARGTCGPSLLFETPGDPPWLARALRSLPHPVTSSLFAAAYRAIPNDTDFTVLSRAGLRGVNLAFGFGAVRYHTSRDDLAHLDPGSLQHHGDNVLALARALAAEDLEDGASRPTVFFDVLGAFVVSWSERLALPLAVLAALGVLGAAVLPRGEGVRPGALLVGAMAAGVTPLAGAFAALVVYVALRGAMPRLFVAHPGPFVAACWAAGALGAFLVARMAARRAGPTGLFAGAGALFAALGIALAASVPGASHLAVVPALALGAFGIGRSLARPGSEAWALAASIGPAVAAGVVLFPLALLLPPFFGTPAAILAAGLVALAILPLAPLAAAVDGRIRFLPMGLAAAAAIVLAAVAAVRPHSTADAPERLSLAYHEEDGRGRWLAEPEYALPAPMRAVAQFSPRAEAPFPWNPRRLAFVAPAQPLGLPAPRADVLSATEEGGVRHVRARLVSPRGAPVLLLALPASVEVVNVSVAGRAVPPPAPRVRWWLGGGRVVGSVTTPPEGIEMEIDIRGAGPAEVTIVDESPGLPPSGATLASTRPPVAVPSREGDLTLVSARVKI